MSEKRKPPPSAPCDASKRMQRKQKPDGKKPRIHETEYHSALIERIRNSGRPFEIGPTRILLAKEFGFCYGVQRAVDLAYETVERFSGRRIFITAEIIHNPRVNARLREMGVRFLSGALGDGSTFDDLSASDIVILPAFGVSVQTERLLRARGCVLVDTTCGSVVHVWKRVERYARDGFTSLIHGAYSHEETIATASRAAAEGGKHLVVRNEEETKTVCRLIEGLDVSTTALDRFAEAASPDLDWQRDLERIGLANQTTMRSAESLLVANMVREAMVRRHGEDYAKANFRSFDTICSATQDRQDAMSDLQQARPDLVLIVGGFNSSNTGHLREIAARFSPAYHVEGRECLISQEEIVCKPAAGTEPTTVRDWLPVGPLTIGLTAGASTPDRVTGEVIERLLELRGVDLNNLQFPNDEAPPNPTGTESK